MYAGYWRKTISCMYVCMLLLQSSTLHTFTCYMFRWPGWGLFWSLPCVLVWLQFVLTFAYAYMYMCTCTFQRKYPAFITLAPSILRPRVSKNCGKIWYGLLVWDKVGNITFSGGPLFLSRDYSCMQTCMCPHTHTHAWQCYESSEHLKF